MNGIIGAYAGVRPHAGHRMVPERMEACVFSFLCSVVEFSVVVVSSSWVVLVGVVVGSVSLP